MIIVAALLTAAAVLVLRPRPLGVAAGRLRHLTVAKPDPVAADVDRGIADQLDALGRSADLRRRSPRAGSRGPSHLLAAVTAGLGLAVLVGGGAGAVAGTVVTGIVWRWLSRLEPLAVRVRRAQIEADLPVAADLLAACLLAGSSPVGAVAAVADAVDGPLGGQLRRVVAILRLGGDPATSWLALADEPALASLGWSLARAAEGGGALAPAVARIADEQRLARRWAADAAARRVGVLAAAPLGLCFLPAFVLIGVVPVIAGIASGLAV